MRNEESKELTGSTDIEGVLGDYSVELVPSNLEYTTLKDDIVEKIGGKVVRTIPAETRVFERDGKLFLNEPIHFVVSAAQFLAGREKYIDGSADDNAREAARLTQEYAAKIIFDTANLQWKTGNIREDIDAFPEQTKGDEDKYTKVRVQIRGELDRGSAKRGFARKLRKAKEKLKAECGDVDKA